MKQIRSKFMSIAAVLVAGLMAGTATAQTQKAQSAAELIASLKKGGLVVYLRHATTDVSNTDQNREDLTDWHRQRNLSEKGRTQALAIGLAFRALGLPVGDVITSPYCRCIETGKLAFGKVVVSKDLSFSVAEDKKDAEGLAKALRTMLGTKPAGQANTVLISHSGNLQDAAQHFPKPEGVAMIFKPKGNDTFEFVQRVEAEHWSQLAAQSGVTVGAAKLTAKTPTREELCQNPKS